MLALICGTGSLPLAVARAQETAPLVCVLEGFDPEGLAADITFRLETLGSVLKDLQARGVRDICLCGAITRPDIDPSLIDAATAPLVPVLQAAMAQGDDGALRAVMTIFQGNGFTVQSAAELAPDILPPAGVPTLAQPDSHARADIQHALTALADMGARDLGQACLVRDGSILAREDIRGTDAMLADAARVQTPPFAQTMLDDATDWLSGLVGAPKSGLLFKAPKPGQDRRADLPTIGPNTALGAAKAGLSGIVIEAGGVIVLDYADLVRILDAAGLYLWIREP